jgi:hypothetical protein
MMEDWMYQPQYLTLSRRRRSIGPLIVAVGPCVGVAGTTWAQPASTPAPSQSASSSTTPAMLQQTFLTLWRGHLADYV